MKKIIDHWKRGIRALRLPEQRHGEHLVHLLEHANGSALKHFDDYLEAATFALFLGLFGIWTSYARGKSSTTG